MFWCFLKVVLYLKRLGPMATVSVFCIFSISKDTKSINDEYILNILNILHIFLYLCTFRVRNSSTACSFLIGDNQTKLLFQVFSFEGGQSTFQGFSILKVPISPGMQQIKAITWKPFYKSTRKRVFRRAPYKEFKMPDVTTLAETISFYVGISFLLFFFIYG